MPLTTLLVLGLVVGVGAFVQRIAGFGLAVVAAPFVVMVAPQVMPAALLFVVLPLPVLEMARAHRDIRWGPFGWAMAGRLATMPLGVWLAANASHTVTSLLVAGMVLVAVAGSLTRWRVRPSSGIALGAGALTGISATTASIGGPFFGLALQELTPQQARSTLAPFFLFGSLSSLLGLAIGGQISADGLRAGLAWLPFMAVGALAAQPLRHSIDTVRFRHSILALATVSALAVIVRVALT